MALSDEIKERLDIVEVVSSYVPGLQKAGRNYKAPCPFHSERTPSFVVFPERQSWRCFGACATGGDLLSFVMGMEKLSFGDALRLLAQRAGVPMAQRQHSQEQQLLHKVNEAAAAFLQEHLWSSQGMAARAYLQQRRVDTETARRFELGLSPGDGVHLVQHLSALGYSQEQVVQAGLATSVEGLPVRDLFRGRLMFPIRDGGGGLVGFGGRALDGSEPKYLNSPRTAVFDKGRLLYALHLAKAAIKEQGEVVVVEGYMDAIAANQHGFGNVVACMGTALTESQVALLRDRARRYVLALDPDAAGREATFRDLVQSWHALERRLVGRRGDVALYERAADLSAIRIALLPQGKDPDQVIHDDPELWRNLVAVALPVVDYFLSQAPSRWDLTSSQGKAEATQALYPLIAALQNPFEQERYLRRLAEALGTQPAILEASLERPSRSAAPRGKQGSVPRVSASAFETERHDPLEEHLLALLLRWPELRESVRGLGAQALERWENRQVFTLWMECPTIERLLETLQEDQRQRVDYFLSFSIPPMNLHQREQAVKECFQRLEERRLRHLKAEETSLLDRAETEGAAQDLEDLERQIIDTNQRLRSLFSQRASSKHLT